MITPVEKPLRVDARRNRDNLVAVATAAFTDDGIDVALEDIARRARVGIGTLYRHFPTREALVLAVYRHQIEVLRQAAIDLPRRLPPGPALHEWMRVFVGYAGVKRGMVALLKSMIQTDSQLFDETREVIRAAAQSLLDQAQAHGAIRTDMNAADLIRAMSGICMVTDRPGTDQMAAGLIDLIYDGLRYGAAGDKAVAAPD